MDVIHTVAELRLRLKGEQSVVLVPTMGNLHAGHLALVEEAGRRVQASSASAAVDVYAEPDFYPTLWRRSERFATALQAAIDELDAPVRLQHLGPRFGLYFGVREPVMNYRQAAQRDLSQEWAFIRACHARGLYLQPSAHHGFSAVHGDEVLEEAVSIMREALIEVCRCEDPARVVTA